MSVNCVPLLHTFTPEGKQLYYKAESNVCWSICSDLKSLCQYLGCFSSILLLSPSLSSWKWPFPASAGMIRSLLCHTLHLHLFKPDLLQDLGEIQNPDGVNLSSSSTFNESVVFFRCVFQWYAQCHKYKYKRKSHYCHEHVGFHFFIPSLSGWGASYQQPHSTGHPWV